VTLGFKFEKPDIIRDALNQPAGSARTIAPMASLLSSPPSQTELAVIRVPPATAAAAK